jgi:hypothetical protein
VTEGPPNTYQKEKTGPECYECRFIAVDHDSEFGTSLDRDSLAYTKCTLRGYTNCVRWDACSDFKPREGTEGGQP